MNAHIEDLKSETIEPFSVPCACSNACKGSWALPTHQFCRWNNPSKAVDWETKNKELAR